MKTGHKFEMALALVLLSSAAAAQKPVIYPAKGQSAAQQQKDEGECHVWAKGNTGIDPAAVAGAPPPPPAGPQGERVRGAVRGAVGGAAIGAIAGDTSKGAGVGAVAGTMAGGREARKNQASQQQQATDQKAQQMNTYYRALGACMDGRGYKVK